MTDGIYSFDNFVSDKDNLFAYSVCRSVAAGGEGVFNPVIICGPGGCGKTHLLYSVYGELTKYGAAAGYMEMERFVDEFILPDTGSGIADIKEQTLLIDDAQVLQGRDTTQSEVYRALRSLCASGKRVIVAMDIPLAALPAFYDEAMADKGRTSLCVLDIPSPTRSFKLHFIREMCRMTDVVLDDASVSYLAESLGDNLRVIKGCIKMIRFYKNISSADIDLCWLKKNITDEMKGA